MSKKETSKVEETLDSEQLDSVVGGAGPDLTTLSRLQPRRGDVINPINTELLSGFRQPVVRPSEGLHVVNPDWVSDSISVEGFCVGWSKDYDDPPPEPEPKDPDGGTGGGGGGGGAPGRFDLEGIDLGQIDALGRNGGLIRR